MQKKTLAKKNSGRRVGLKIAQKGRRIKPKAKKLKFVNIFDLRIETTHQGSIPGLDKSVRSKYCLGSFRSDQSYMVTKEGEGYSIVKEGKLICSEKFDCKPS